MLFFHIHVRLKPHFVPHLHSASQAGQLFRVLSPCWLKLNLSAQTSGEVSVLPLRKATTNNCVDEVRVRRQEKTAEACRVACTADITAI